ncbi:MAG: phosphatidylserine decarboxylase [Candidatus Scatosoma sp.]
MPDVNASEMVAADAAENKYGVKRRETADAAASAPSGALKFLYNTKLGGAILKLLTARWVSKAAGKYLDSRFSRRKIKKYVKKHGIDMSLYEQEDYPSFNAFFTRKIRKELRPFDTAPEAFVAPCDGKLSLYKIEKGAQFTIKGFTYTAAELLKDERLAKTFEGGYCFIFRLCVEDYHRYFYFDDGQKGENVFIAGRLHTVQPVALEKRRVFCENCREYTVMQTERFGTAVQCEVGAMMVGRIVNYHGAGKMLRGQEKGKFEFGGSTVVVLTQAGAVEPDAEFLLNTAQNKETKVKCGERIGTAGRGASKQKTDAPPER